MFSVYGIYDPVDPEHVRYIGYTGRNLVDRLASHIEGVIRNLQKELQRKSVRWAYSQKGIAKIISENRAPEIFVIAEAGTKENAHILEKLYIREHRKAGHRLWNLTDGGDGGDTFSNKSEEEKENTRKKLSDKVPWNKGKKASAETCEKLSEALKGRKHSIEHRVKIGEALKGRKHSKETRKKISNANKGKSSSMKGRKFTEEHRKKIGNSNRGKRRSIEILTKNYNTRLDESLSVKEYLKMRIAKEQQNLRILMEK